MGLSKARNCRSDGRGNLTDYSKPQITRNTVSIFQPLIFFNTPKSLKITCSTFNIALNSSPKSLHLVTCRDLGVLLLRSSGVVQQCGFTCSISPILQNQSIVHIADRHRFRPSSAPTSTSTSKGTRNSNALRRHIAHQTSDQFADRFDFRFRHFKHQFVMHLHCHTRLQFRARAIRFATANIANFIASAEVP